MMHMSGLTEVEYYLGLFLGDITLFAMPAVVLSLCLFAVPEIMNADQVGYFFISYILYGMSVIKIVYAISHAFDNPETGRTYVALIFVLGLLFLPIALSLIAAAIFGFDNSVGNAITVWYWVNPQICFCVQVYTLCSNGKPELDDL